MKFGPVPTEACDGAVLAHALNLPDGRIRKGTRLDTANYCTRLEPQHHIR